MHVLDGLTTKLPCAIERNIGHGAWAVERYERDQVLETISAHLAYRIAHARAFQLEHAHRVALSQNSEGRFVIERDLVGIEIRDALADKALRLVDYGERLEA